MLQTKLPLAVLAVAGAVSLASLAVAADMPKALVYKAPASSVPYSWTGFYLGGHGGVGRSRDWQGSANGLPDPATFGMPVLNFDQNDSGAVGGGQIGYNWQFAPQWLVGIEADMSAARLSGGSSTSPIPILFFPFTTPGSVSMSRDVDWLASLRGRFGFVSGRWLAYATGGVAWAHIQYDGLINDVAGARQYASSFSTVKTGWTLGGGLEYALPTNWGDWTVRGEYLYYAFGSAEATVGATPVPAGSVRYEWNDTNIHVVRLGLSYKFGRGF